MGFDGQSASMVNGMDLFGTVFSNFCRRPNCRAIPMIIPFSKARNRKMRERKTGRCIPIIISVFLSRIFLFRAFPSTSGDFGLTSAMARYSPEMSAERRRRFIVLMFLSCLHRRPAISGRPVAPETKCVASRLAWYESSWDYSRKS